MKNTFDWKLLKAAARETLATKKTGMLVQGIVFGIGVGLLNGIYFGGKYGAQDGVVAGIANALGSGLAVLTGQAIWQTRTIYKRMKNEAACTNG